MQKKVKKLLNIYLVRLFKGIGKVYNTNSNILGEECLEKIKEDKHNLDLKLEE